MEVAGIAIGFVVLSTQLQLVGVTAAMIAFVGGRLAGNVYLIAPCLRVLRRGG